MTTGTGRKNMLKRLLILVPVVAAVMIVAALVRSKKAPEKLPFKEVARQVRVLKMAPVDVVPLAVGYGQVTPGREWQVVPEVSGRIVAVSPAFKKGSLVKKGDVLLSVDPIDFELAVRQMGANIARIEAQLAELAAREKNHRATLKIQQAVLALSKKELDRHLNAMVTRSISDSALDKARISYQGQRHQLQEIENALALIPASKASLAADLSYNRARLEEAHLDLKRTDIVVPYGCRITETSAEVGQYVQQGQTIARADGIGRAEIAAQLPLSAMRKLLAGATPSALALDSKALAVNSETMDRLRMDKLRDLFGLSVSVRLVGDAFGVAWDARFARADATIDPQTRTVGIIVAVDNPYGQVVIGQRPPLVRNMFCGVTITGRSLPGRMVIPRSALHDGHVYVVDAKSRLARKEVTVGFSQGDFHVLAGGLSAGELVVVSDLLPAIDGMLLETVFDEELAERLLAQTGATGTGH